jgi:hypothetical protein
MAVVVALQNAQTILVMSDAAVAAPNPTSPSMQTVTEMVAPNQMPVPTDHTPMSTIPALQNAQAVQMVPDASFPTPEPPVGSVVMILSPKSPVSTNISPMAIVVPLQNAPAVLVCSDPTIPTPNPAGAPMRSMTVVIAAPQVPVASHLAPSRTSPPEQDA